VSWQVTGVRADKFADANRVVAEPEKEVKGTYLHPELYSVDPAMQESTHRNAREAAAQRATNPTADQ
jgi:hypothetical protein